jgi:hypothetical protein
MTLANVTISSGNVTITNVSVTTANVTTLNATTVIATTANVTTANITTGNVTNMTSGNVAITGGSINGTTLGATTASTANVTTLTTSSTVTINGGTANGVAYLNGSKVLTTGSALTFDGTDLATTGSFSTGDAQNISLNASSSGQTNRLQWKYQGTAYAWIERVNSNGDMAFGVQSSEAMRLTSTSLYTASGINVGIGTSSPVSKLNVVGTTGITWASAGASSGLVTIGTQGTGGSLFVQTPSVNDVFASGFGVDGTYDGGKSVINLKAFGTASGGSYSADMAFFTTTNTTLSEKMRLDSSGNLGLGVTPSASWSTANNYSALQLRNSSLYFRSAAAELYINNNTVYNGTNWLYAVTAAAARYDMEGAAHKWFTAASGTAGNAISFTQAMTLDASGRLGIGVTSPVTKLQVNVASDTSIHCYSPSANVAQIASLNDAGNNSKQLNFDGNPLVFKVADAERARINSSGNLLVGASTSDLAARIMCIGSNGLAVQYGASSGTNLQIIPGDANGNVNLKFDARSGAYPAATFWTSDLERARITSGGDLLVACTSFPSGSSAGFGFNASQYAYFSRSSGESLNLDRFTTEGKTQVLRYAGTEVGNISVTASATAYNTSSDYRLKDKPQPLTGSGAFIDSLKPKTWAWKSDGSKGVGFIAHEVQEVSPGSVVGEKDAVDAEGNPVYQAMEYGSAEFIANIIAELQSLRARVAQLEAK